MSNACGARQDTYPADLKEVFADHLKQQGSSWDIFVDKVNDVVTQKSGVMIAKSDGYLRVDLAGIRQVLVRHQAEGLSNVDKEFCDSCEDGIDPAGF